MSSIKLSPLQEGETESFVRVDDGAAGGPDHVLSRNERVRVLVVFWWCSGGGLGRGHN
jgi:hypothetical protein